MRWHMVRVVATDKAAVAEALFDAGALGVQEESDAVITHFPSSAAACLAGEAARRVDPAASVEIGVTEPQDWSQWRASVRAWTVDDITVSPPWFAESTDPKRTVVIDPGMAFGTGEHATTRGILTLMQHVLTPGDTVADLGTGSGVLAIAAAKLGASRAVGIEHDRDAVANAEANVRANDAGDRVTIIEGDAATLLPLLGPMRLLLANITSLALVALLPVMLASLAKGGMAVISGILESERRGFLRYAGSWAVIEELTEEDWWTAAIAPR